MYRIKGLVIMLLGVLLVGFGVALNIAWVIFCFGTVFIGVVLLLFFTPILLLPYAFLGNIGWRLIEHGVLVYRRIVI